MRYIPRALTDEQKDSIRAAYQFLSEKPEVANWFVNRALVKSEPDQPAPRLDLNKPHPLWSNSYTDGVFETINTLRDFGMFDIVDNRLVVTEPGLYLIAQLAYEGWTGKGFEKNWCQKHNHQPEVDADGYEVIVLDGDDHVVRLPIHGVFFDDPNAVYHWGRYDPSLEQLETSLANIKEQLDAPEEPSVWDNAFFPPWAIITLVGMTVAAAAYAIFTNNPNF